MLVPEVKKKIRNLRSTYTHEVQKIVKKSSPDSMYESSLCWFHEMNQCLKFLSDEKSISASVDMSQETQEDSDLDQTVCSSEDKTIDSCLEENSDPLISLLYNEYDTSATIEAVEFKSENGSLPDHHNLLLKRKNSKTKKTSQYFIQSQSETWSKEDEFDVYGKYIATQLRQMELQTALNVQLQIQNLIKVAKVSAFEVEN